MSEINDFVKELRERRKLSLREAGERSGLSHSYISSLENGKHPQTKAPINPSPETLKKLSEAYNSNYEEMMVIAGYIEENKKESDFTLPESEYENIIREIENKYSVDLHDDPIVLSSVRQIIEAIAQTKIAQLKDQNR